jgi:alanine-glyoxylate transaminase/serine-glyoxylate transaminase/serine-pyruvate transaminase
VGLELVPLDDREHSASLTAVLMPDGHDADELRALILERYDVSLGAGLGKLAGKVFRIGHLGDLNDVWLAGALAGVEMGLAGAGVPIRRGGVQAALDHLAETAGAGVGALR